MSTNPTKWSNTPTIFVGYWQRVVWVYLIILWGWRSKGKPFLAMISFVAIFPPKTQENLCVFWCCNPLSANPTKWSNTLKQFVGNLPTNCVSGFDHFVILALRVSKKDCGLFFFWWIIFVERGKHRFLCSKW